MELAFPREIFTQGVFLNHQGSKKAAHLNSIPLFLINTKLNIIEIICLIYTV